MKEPFTRFPSKPWWVCVGSASLENTVGKRESICNKQFYLVFKIVQSYHSSLSHIHLFPGFHSYQARAQTRLAKGHSYEKSSGSSENPGQESYTFPPSHAEVPQYRTFKHFPNDKF